MATRTTTIITDDLDGSEGATSHTFALDKQVYSIDLSDANFAKLQAALQPFIDKAPSKAKRSRVAASASPAEYDRAAFKTWAVENDVKLGRGRPPRSLVEAFIAGERPAPDKASARKPKRS